MTSRRLSAAFLVAAVLALGLQMGLFAQAPERVDLDAVFRIKEEGLQRSKVMDTMSYLTDVYGPRLTGSPNIKKAADFTQKRLTEWGATNVHLETFPFGRGWTNEIFSARVVTPQSYPVIGYAKAWTPGTKGPVTGDVVIATIESERDFDKFRGKLRGKMVFTALAREVRASMAPLGRRYTDTELADISRQPITAGGGRGGRGGGAEAGFPQKRMQFLIAEGAVALIDPGRGDGGTVFVQSGGSRNVKDPPVLPQAVLAVEHYNRIVRTLERNIPVTLELSIDNRFDDTDLNAFNIVGDIPGTDKAAELVMLGAHFDSWHTGTGATDNAAGSAVMLEAMRILKATGLKMRRTVRIGLWSGEEQGLLGSRAYVQQHFGDRQTMQLKPDHERMSAYFNVDNGTGAIRGVYLQGNEAAAPVFTSWMEPFKNVGMTTLTIRNTGGTDHQSFDAVGLPGFQFIQDPVEYDSRTHHSNMDVYDRVQAADMIQNAVIVASFAYHAANREARFPRKPLPRPQGRGATP